MPLEESFAKPLKLRSL